jgi:hypothetical protein
MIRRAAAEELVLVILHEQEIDWRSSFFRCPAHVAGQGYERTSSPRIKPTKERPDHELDLYGNLTERRRTT